MPGKRYRYRVTAGHLAGEDVRVMTCSETARCPAQGAVIVQTRRGEQFEIPGDWLISRKSQEASKAE